MLTTKVKKRAYLLAATLTASVVAIFFILKSLSSNILYFKSPTEIKNSNDTNFNKKIRVGGMVKKNSLEIDSEEIKFTITDFENEIMVSYSGTVPNLFTEEKALWLKVSFKIKNFL